ncbi:hypothetical protein NKDENANG_03435 [Candidatus Entotheonellaceae bacterium PAL068K]
MLAGRAEGLRGRESIRSDRGLLGGACPRPSATMPFESDRLTNFLYAHFWRGMSGSVCMTRPERQTRMNLERTPGPA